MRSCVSVVLLWVMCFFHSPVYSLDRSVSQHESIEQLDSQGQVQYLIKENILRQMFDNIGSTALNVSVLSITGIGGTETIMTMDVYRQFVQAMRHIGGTVTFENANRNNFLTNAADANGVFVSNAGDDWGNPNATFANFIGDVAQTNIRNLTGDLASGYAEMSEFARIHFPAIADALGHMAEVPISNIHGDPTDIVCGPVVDQNGNIVNATVPVGLNGIHWEIGESLAQVFTYSDTIVLSYSLLGVPIDDRNVDELNREMEALYNPLFPRSFFH